MGYKPRPLGRLLLQLRGWQAHKTNTGTLSAQSFSMIGSPLEMRFIEKEQAKHKFSKNASYSGGAHRGELLWRASDMSRPDETRNPRPKGRSEDVKIVIDVVLTCD